MSDPSRAPAHAAVSARGPHRSAPPAPPVLRALPLEEPPVLPEEILLESRGVLTRRLLRSSWRSAITLVVLWELLVLGYVQSSAPTLWAMSPLYLIDPTISVGMILRLVGFTPSRVGLALVLVPILGTALSAALVPLASAWTARLNPRRFRSAQAARAEVRRRIALVMVLPPAAAIALLLAGVLLPLDLQWHELSYGVIAGFAGGIGLTWLAARIVRASVPIDSLLAPDAPAAEAENRTAPFGGPALVAPHDEVLGPDPRTLPPTGDLDPLRVAARSLRIVGRRMLTFAGGTALALVWLVFGIADAVVFFSRMGSADLDVSVRTGLPGPTWVIGAGLALLAALGVAVAPLIAIALAPRRPGEIPAALPSVGRAGTYPAFPQAAGRVPDPMIPGPWESRVATIGTVVVSVGLLGAVVVLGLALGLIGELDALAITWIVIDVLVLLPLAALAARSALRWRLRDIVEGPVGLYARRRARWALIAPAAGTRELAASDPLVRARRAQLGLAERARSGLAPIGGEASSRRGDAGRDAPASGELPDFGHDAGRRPSAPPALGAGQTGIPEDISELYGAGPQAR